MTPKTTRVALVAALLAATAIAAIPDAAAASAGQTLRSGNCIGEYETGENSTSSADDYCVGAWSDGGIQCIGIYLVGTKDCIGVEPALAIRSS
jgi:hypothetical protein